MFAERSCGRSSLKATVLQRQARQISGMTCISTESCIPVVMIYQIKCFDFGQECRYDSLEQNIRYRVIERAPCKNIPAQRLLS
jgi:hypothetical protein